MSSKLSRRDFAKSAALAVTAAVAAPADLLAQSEKPSPVSPPQEQPQKPSATPPSAPELSPAARAEAQQCYQALLQKYGTRFTEEQKKDIARLLDQQQKGIEAVRAFALENSDEPSTMLRLYVREEESHAAPR
jgi:hypothetical protein